MSTSPKGTLELENWVTWKSRRGHGYDGSDSLDFRHEFEYGVTDRLQVSLYVADWSVLDDATHNRSARWNDVAVETMRKCMDSVPIAGTIVIGEGERDEAPMLYIGEKVGLGAVSEAVAARLPAIDIAVDPLEGTNLCATGAPNAIVVLAASNRGGVSGR